MRRWINEPLKQVGAMACFEAFPARPRLESQDSLGTRPGGDMHKGKRTGSRRFSVGSKDLRTNTHVADRSHVIVAERQGGGVWGG